MSGERVLVPFNRPWFAGPEVERLRTVLEGDHHHGRGPSTYRCEDALAGVVGGGRTFLTPSCTAALEMSALLLDLGPEDEVIVPSFTFVSTANAFALRGVRIVFADVRPDTFNLDERHVDDLLTNRTKAIVPVHYAGISCEMDAILEAAGRVGAAVVEDNAHGLFASYRGRPLGSMGAMATQSFHDTKNVSCGEGGALVVNDPELVDRAEIVQEKGTDRRRFFRGQVDKYSWVDLGSSFILAEPLAAILEVQLEEAEKIQRRRRRVWERYRDALGGWAASRGVRLPFVPEDREQPYHMFYLLMPSLEDRQRFIENMRDQGIYAVFHYTPLHSSPAGRRMGGRPGMCPVTEDISDRLVRLPFYTGMTSDDQERVVEAILRFD